MINTELHNTLVEKEILNKQIEFDKINQRAKTELMVEKLKSVLLVIGVVFIVCLLIIFLYWLFPNKHNQNTVAIKQVEQLLKNCKCDCNCTQKKIVQKKGDINKKQQNNIDRKIPKNGKLKNGKLKNGDEYIKYNNYIYKRSWKNGVLIEEIKMKPTIDESRKNGEQIPQFSIPSKKQ
jgi:hypothetical protein